MDLNGDTLAKLKQILPEIFSEGADGKPSIDIERLKIALGDEVDIEADDKTRYSFNWSGKKQAQALANQPSTAALRPSVEDSKNWDDTQNIYIEGDNLEVLKLLQKSYYGQIKMIYIDPPYNTGKDFVYKDNFHDNVKNYLQLTGQVDDDGNRISTNTDKSGRYHTDWLNMMYPRLKLARNLLKDDGVIFISIDDKEGHNLRKICDEIFGEDNFVVAITREAIKGGSVSKFIRKVHDFVLVYSKSIDEVVFGGIEVDGVTLDLEDENGKYARGRELNKWGAGSRREDSPGMWFPVPGPNGEEIYPTRNDGSDGRWRLGKQKMHELISNGNAIYEKRENGTYVIYEKIRDDSNRIKQFTSLFKDSYINAKGTDSLKSLFSMERSLFDYSKPLELITDFMLMSNTLSDDIILDFFSGSATTAHAVMQLNAEDGGSRKYICVQLPEATATDSEAYKAGYKNICEIGKERIRRAGEKVLAEWQEKQTKNDLLAEDNKSSTIPDIGFKVFKLDTSNFKPFDGNFFSEEMILSGRTSLDLFYELVLKQGYSLDYKQQILDIGGTQCYALVNDDGMPFVLAVLDNAVKANFALELLKYALTLVIIKDDCFATDELKLNTLATLEQLQSKDNPLQIRIV
ncbi:site-specific DNA-methyltransferase [Aquella oligotrophica]|uniref:site-specific DNA-methyltransferase (adenine-specific) n=2 Tax=Aquella oligotrophica TaxID=2067065 RepID=A0A2I7N9M1_9NEIS|nr:site-specific DNA-methyltransferase [Aquella oligotrophica]